jgi:hypothetical protein
MIDEAFETEFESRLRATLDEMIPKLVASEISVDDGGSEATAHVVLTRRIAPTRGARRVAVASLAAAAMLVGLLVIATRDTGEVVPGDGSPAADAGLPAWYGLIAPSLPERFPYVALTFATDAQLFFVAINPLEGKTLDIRLTSGGYQAGPTSTVDATGAWAETAQGWSVGTPAGLFVEVSCDIGVGGRNYVGTTNYCDFAAGINPFTKDEIRAVANSLATSLTVSIFDQNLGRASGDPIDPEAATALISAAAPGQPIGATDMGDGADHIYNVGAGFGSLSPSDSLPPLDAVPPRADTSVRILHGVVPAANVNAEPVTDLYDDAAVVSVLGSGGVYIRISTPDSSLQSVTRLAQLARDLIALDPATVTTVSETVATAAQPDDTAVTVGQCEPSSNPPLVVVANASNVNGIAMFWKNLLAANVPTIQFADPKNARENSRVSRVLALDGLDCNASIIAHLTTGVVESATPEALEAVVLQPLPAGTSIVVVIGNDHLSAIDTGPTSSTP